ncbi:HAMP domain-containing sensor histidine kinase [Cohnella sp. REN36]|uniref:sensor histidine kinase n=1 Tax=Cohnella sp. REN36 TaxID=2887347 RepID=UPI001D14FAEE|nr:HAMP domain-containing sensor histidine kinase [Cohnella sp. REN36]MCC3373565.1 HAMP domain-containing histidine kinase [Cohnella sp. REN36]
MSIKLRLLLSYIAMFMVPIMIFVLFSAFLIAVFYKDIKSLEDASSNNAGKPWFQIVSDYFDKKNELVGGIRFLAKYDPDRLADNIFLTKTDEQLRNLREGLVIVTDDRVTFASKLADGIDLKEELQHLDTNRWGQNINNTYSVERIDFHFSDDRSGTVYILTDFKQFFGFISKFFPSIFLSLLVAIILTNGLLTFFVSRSIIKPLYALKQAAEHIQEGDLEHEVKMGRRDEIGKLGDAFEEMRRRLKASIQLQNQYEENRKELISNISHDLKTPITGIKACIDGIFDGIADTDQKRNKYLRMVYKKATDMDQLIDELFLFSKLDLKRLPFHFMKIDISDYLRDFVEDLRHDPQKQGVLIDFRCEGSHPVYVLVDMEKLRRVMANIVDNGIKYTTREPKEIRIELVDQEQEVTVSVRDNGMGISEDALAHIFDRFYRVEHSRNKKTGGSGLGLAIVKHIVEEHGGKVWAQSALGEGTAIFFTLPKGSGLDGHEADTDHRG